MSGRFNEAPAHNTEANHSLDSFFSQFFLSECDEHDLELSPCYAFNLWLWLSSSLAFPVICIVFTFSNKLKYQLIWNPFRLHGMHLPTSKLHRTVSYHLAHSHIKPGLI